MRTQPTPNRQISPVSENTAAGTQVSKRGQRHQQLPWRHCYYTQKRQLCKKSLEPRSPNTSARRHNCYEMKLQEHGGGDGNASTTNNTSARNKLDRDGNDQTCATQIGEGVPNAATYAEKQAGVCALQASFCDDGAPGEAGKGKEKTESCGKNGRHTLPKVTPNGPGDRRKCAKVDEHLLNNCRTSCCCNRSRCRPPTSQPAAQSPLGNSALAMGICCFLAATRLLQYSA